MLVYSTFFKAPHEVKALEPTSCTEAGMEIDVKASQ